MPFPAGSIRGLPTLGALLLLGLLAPGIPVGPPVNPIAATPVAVPLLPDAPAVLASTHATSAAPVPASAASPWVNRTPGLLPNIPPARRGGMIAYDAADGYLLLFGGLAARGGGPLHDSWKFQDGAWTNLTPTLALSPPGRYKATMAYDPVDREVVLYGGLHNGGYLGDTWAFSGGTWSQLLPTGSPGPLEDAGMTFDVRDGYLVLFGGDNTTGVDLAQTWSFVAGAWSDLTPRIARHPPPEETAPLTYDPTLSEVLLFGGQGVSGSLAQTWTYANLTWTNLTGTTGATPSAREAPTLAYDAADGFDLLFGGLHFPSTLNDTWEFVGGKWVALAPALAPPARFEATMAYSTGPSAGHAGVVLFGGQTSPSNNNSALSDTWTFKIPLGGNVTVSPLAIDKGQSVTVKVAAVGGIGPYSVSWPALPANCVGISSPGSFTCSPGIPGSDVFVAEITDNVNDSYVVPAVNLSVAEDPTATVSATPTVGPSPLPVAFRVAVAGGTRPFTYAWSFGDGSNSSAGNTSHTFGRVGTFRANLTVTDAAGVLAVAAPVSVQVTSALVASAAASAYVGIAPFTVSFTATVSGGLSPYDFNWSFGNSSGFSNDQNPVFTFASAGRVPVRLAVQDALGGVSRSWLNVTVIAPLTESFTAAFPGGALCSAGRPVATLDLAATPVGGVGPYNETWAVSGLPSDLYGASASATIGGGSGLTVQLTVTDSRGTTATSTQGLTAPTVSCATPSEAPSPSTFNLLWAIVAVLAAVVAIEAVVIVYRRRKDRT